MWGPPAPDVPSFEVVDPPEAPDVRPLVPAERDTECLDRLGKLTELVAANAKAIGEIKDSYMSQARFTAGERQELRVSLLKDMAKIQEQIKEHSHDQVEPTPDELDALVAAVIEKLPPLTVWNVDDVTGEITKTLVKPGGEFTIHTTIPQ